MNRINNTYRRLENKKYGTMLFLICWTVYFSLYIGRRNLGAVMPQMINEEFLAEDLCGIVSMSFFFAYGIGQLINGILGDRISPFAMIFAGTFGAGAMNLATGLFITEINASASAVCAIFAVIWGLNGFFQSMIWSPIVRILATIMPSEQRVRASINMSSSAVAGTLGAYAVSVLVLAVLPWRYSFVTAGVLLIAVSLVWCVISGKIIKLSRVEKKAPDVSAPVRGITERRLFPLLVSSGVIFMLLPIAMQGVLNYGITEWVPTLISANFGVKSQWSTMLTMILPIVNLTGAYTSYYADKRIFKNEMKSAAAFFALAAAATAVMYFSINSSLVLTLCMLAVTTSSMMAINVLMITFVPMYFGSFGRSSSVTGILDAVAYCGCAVSTYLIGYFVKKYRNWDGTIILWLLTAAAAILLCLIGVRVWGRFKAANAEM